MAALPTWFITGASSGLGKAIALEALGRGHRVVATARSVAALAPLASAGASVLALDVTSPPETVDAVVSAAIKEHGPITHVLNGAGYMLSGTVEECSAAEVEAQWNTNVIGTITVSRAFIPHLRQQPAGTCVVAGFGSLASWRAAPGVTHYCATKWATSAVMASLDGELEPFGIRAVSIEPGFFRTPFLGPGRTVQAATAIDAYVGTTACQARAWLDSLDNTQPGDPVKGAKVIVDVLTGTGVAAGKRMPPRLPLGSDTITEMKNWIAASQQLLEEWSDVAISTDYDK